MESEDRRNMVERFQSSSTKSEMADDEAVSSNSFCRICLMRQPNLKPLMNHIDGVMIPEMLYKLCGRQIEVQESYPKSICDRCLCLLDSAFSFLNLFYQQDERLRSFYWNGPVVDRLNKYQGEAKEVVESRLEALLTRNGSMFTDPVRKSSVSTITDPLSVLSVGINTEPEKEFIHFSTAVKTEPNDADMLEDMIEIETEEGFLSYNSEAADSDSEKMVAMKIDVLNSAEHSEEELKLQRRRPRMKQRRAALRRSKRRKAVNEESIKEEHDGIDPGDTDDQSQTEPDPEHFDDSELVQEPDDTIEVIDPFRCYICDYLAEGDEQLEEHVESHTLMLPYECKECIAEGADVRRFKTVSSLHNHFRSHLYPHRCDTCGRRFLRKSLLVTHRESHANVVYTCEECGRQFTHRKTWQNHVQRHSAMRTEVFKCDVCDKAFGNKPRLARHMQVHTGKRPYGCKYCSKRFSDRHQLQCHTEKHIRDKECHCEVCGDKFPDHRKLDEHKIELHLSGAELQEFLAKKQMLKTPRRVSKLQDDRCPYPGCEYRARTYGAMYVHKRTKHLTLHQCEVCSKTFAFLNQLNVHLKLHTGEKPHECELCGRKFRRVFSYREHMEMHKSDNTYVCSVCQKSFKRPRYLQAHMLTHSSTRKFSCELCGNCYKTNGELKKHSRHKHGLEIAEELTEIVNEGEHPSEMYVVEYV